ncbi:hypothetical protein TNCV_356471 [Trichonephila clavipes]|nr:hypothetical protein TNCV_356471 [Trichonephila clavipes]
MHWISIQCFHTEASSAECAARYAVDFDVVGPHGFCLFLIYGSVDSMGKVSLYWFDSTGLVSPFVRCVFSLSLWSGYHVH